MNASRFFTGRLVPLILSAIALLALPVAGGLASEGPQMLFWRNGDAEPNRFDSVAPGDVLRGRLVFDAPQDRYISVHCWVRRAKSDEEENLFQALFCRTVPDDPKVRETHSLAINHQAPGAARINLEPGDTLILKAVMISDTEIGRLEFPFETSRREVKTKRPTTTELLQQGDGEIIAVSQDPETGRIEVVRRMPDGAIVRSSGSVERDEDGTVRVKEIDEDGNERVTSAFPDGRIRTTTKRADLSSEDTLVRPDGTVVHAERTADGYITLREVEEDGSVTTVEYDLDGSVRRSVSETPDGWRLSEDQHGNLSMSRIDDRGVGASIEVDSSGNAMIVYHDEDGATLGGVIDRVGPREPGRAYFENVLGERGWDDLPDESKVFYADEAASARVKAAYDAKKRAAEQADRAAEELQRAEDEAARAAMEAKLAVIRARQEEADRRVAEAERRAERERELDESWVKAQKLRRQYREAVEAGDAEEAARIAGLQDEHAEASAELLKFTAEESAEMELAARVRSDLASRVHGRAAALAESEIAELDAYQNAKVKTTDKTKWVSMGSQMQQSTDRTTRLANYSRAMAAAKVREIDRMLDGDTVSAQERRMLLQMRRAAIDQEASAEALLRSNGRLTALGYTTDAALILTGGKLVEGSNNFAKGVLNRALSEQTGTRVGTLLAERGALELAGRGVTRATSAAASKVSPGAAQAIERAFGTDLGAVSADATRRILGEGTSRALANTAARTGEVLMTDVRELGSRLVERGRASAARRFGERTEIMTAEEHQAFHNAAKQDAHALLAETYSQPTVSPATNPARMTPAQRQAYNDAAAMDAVMNAPGGFSETLMLGDDVLRMPSYSPPALTWSMDDLIRIHRPGANLSRADIHLKAELYRQREVARHAGVQAMWDGLDDAAAHWQQQFRFYDRLISDAKAAAR